MFLFKLIRTIKVPYKLYLLYDVNLLPIYMTILSQEERYTRNFLSQQTNPLTQEKPITHKTFSNKKDPQNYQEASFKYKN